MRFLSGRTLIPAFVLFGILLGVTARFFGAQEWEGAILLTTLLLGSIPLAYEIIRSMLRLKFGVDLIAIVAIIASAVLGQYLAGAVILLMLSGGEALESYALHRARKDLTDLIERAPRIAHKVEGEIVKDVSVETIHPSDVVLIKPGEMIPVDGVIVEGESSVDESLLTGESMPIRKRIGSLVMSGSVSGDGVLRVRSTKSTSESKYQQIIRLVREAETKKAPFARLADRSSVWFTSATFVLAVLAWFLSHDPIRLLAVLVVATPCPLILAVPIAFACGISRAATLGIIVRSGGSLEKMGRAQSFAFDKTGTLTLGAPGVDEIIAFEGSSKEDVLRLAASLDQLSAHVLARSLTREALRRSLVLSSPRDFSEVLGEGVKGVIEGQTYIFGRFTFLASAGMLVTPEVQALHNERSARGQISVFLGSGSKVLGAILFSDAPRPDAARLFHRLTELGIRKVLMITGDRKAAALEAAKRIGFPEESVLAECLPEQKVEAVLKMRQKSPPVVMVGDGVNDAPAIAAADVGIAMGSHGDTASSAAGDVVILVDKIERVADALAIGKRVLLVAEQSVGIGIGLSLVLMVLAAFGFILPLFGAMLQEVIDVIVILNALRALRVRESA